MELYPDSATTLSIVEHSLFKSITDKEIKEEHTTWVSPEVPLPPKQWSCILSQTRLVMREESNSKLDTNYNETDENYTATLQQHIESSANCTVKRYPCDIVFKIFGQKYEQVTGTMIESNQTVIHLDPKGHLNSAVLSQSNQCPVQVPIHTIDSESFLSQLKLTPKSSPSSVRNPVCIELSGHKQLIDFLVTYLNTDPELNWTLPLFRLPHKTLEYTEEHQLIPYQNIPDGCAITLESLRSMIDSDGVNVSFSLMEN